MMTSVVVVRCGLRQKGAAGTGVLDMCWGAFGWCSNRRWSWSRAPAAATTTTPPPSSTPSAVPLGVHVVSGKWRWWGLTSLYGLPYPLLPLSSSPSLLLLPLSLLLPLLPCPRRVREPVNRQALDGCTRRRSRWWSSIEMMRGIDVAPRLSRRPHWVPTRGGWGYYPKAKRWWWWMSNWHLSDICKASAVWSFKLCLNIANKYLSF